MKKSLPGRIPREIAFLLAFSNTFQELPIDEAILNNEEEDHAIDEFGKKLISACDHYYAEINDLINERLRGWTLSRIPRVSLVVLRLAIAEMLYSGEEKPSVAINEAVELVKKYGADEDYQFVNGLLGSVARDLNLPDEKTNSGEE